MPSDQTEYELFISYARLDNRPIPETYPHGWVTALKEQILADHRQYSTAPLNIFFDQHEIRDMDDWRNRILGALRRSKVLLICLSPNYFKSNPCKWEWDEYQARQHQQLIGSDSHATVYFVEVPGSDEQENAKRLAAIMGKNYTDLRPWFPRGAAAMQEEAVRQRMAVLGQSLWERLERARRALKVPGNLRGMTPYFVGRNQELADLHRHVGVGKIGLVTAVHGLGGQGKTELAVAYARGYADCYPLGLWSLGAEGKKELLPLLGDLAWVVEFGYTPSDAERNDAEKLGRAVLTELQRRAELLRQADPKKAPAALLLLDNVSESELLSAPQLSRLPKVDWLRIIATTRLDPKLMDPVGKQVGTVVVESLDPENALRLIVDHLPDGKFASAQDEADAKQIVKELGGFTLAIEQVAVFLGLSAQTSQPISPGEYLARLRADGLPSTDDLVKGSVSLQMEHQEKQLGPVLRSMLAELPEAGRTLLQFASLLPPDVVPWPWLRELTLKRHPELGNARPGDLDPWVMLRRQIEGLRFLTPGDREQTARMHRLVAAHLNPSRGLQHRNHPLTAWAHKVVARLKISLRLQPSLDLRTELCNYLGQRADSISRTQSTPAEWELDALSIALPHLLNEQSTRSFLNDTMFLADKLLVYRTIPAAKSLLIASNFLLQRLVDSDRGNATWQDDLSVSLNKLGDLALAQGNLPEAQRLFTESLCIRQRLTESDPPNAIWQRNLSVSLERLADVAVAQGNLSEAQRFCTASHRIAQRLAEFAPGNAYWQRDLAVSLNKLGELALTQGNLPEAQRIFAESLRIAQRLAEFEPGNVEWQRGESVSLERLGNVAVAQGSLPEAQWLFTESLCIRQRLAESDSGNVEWQRDLSVSLGKLGALALSQGNLREAQRFFAESLPIAQRLAESDPANAKWQRDLWVSHTRVADVLGIQADAKAIHHYRRAHDILANMVQQKLHVSPQDQEALQQLRAKLDSSSV